MLFVYLLLLVLLHGNEAHRHKFLWYDSENQEFACNQSGIGHRSNKAIFKDIKCKENDTVEVSAMTCVSWNNKTKSMVGSLCPYFQDSFNVSIENESDPFCDHLNRHGYLCSNCSTGYRLPLNSYTLKCKHSSECRSYHWILFLLVETSPVTIMFIIFMFCNVKLTAGYANCYIAYSQIISLQMNTLSNDTFIPNATLMIL